MDLFLMISGLSGELPYDKDGWRRFMIMHVAGYPASEGAQSKVRLALIDPPLTTFAYDQALAKDLIHGGYDPVSYAPRPAPEDGLQDVSLEPVFDPIASHRAVSPLPSRLRLAIKGVDHIGSTTRVLARLRQLWPRSSTSKGCLCRRSIA